MSIKRITISVPTSVASRIEAAAGDKPVSAWVADVIEEHLDQAELERQWLELYHEVSPGRAERRRAAAMHERLTRPRKKGAA